MQRRTFIHSISSLATTSVLPINSFGKFSSNQSENYLASTNNFADDFSNDLAKVTTQTTTVKCNEQAVKIHAIQTGTVAVKRSHLTNHTAHFLTPFKISFDKHFTEFMPIWVWVIEHPEGVIVIDTGENAAVMNPDYFNPAGKIIAKYSARNLKFQVSKENEIGFQLRQLGISNDSIKNVVLTHLHLDHTDGIKDFLKVEIIVNANEFKHPSSHFPELVPDWFKPKAVSYKKDFVEVFHHAYPLTTAEDVLLVPTHGHTKHHASVLFKTDDFDILFAGDVCYNQDQLLANDLPGINVNYKASRQTYRNIATYAQQRKLIFLPSHDANSAKRLNEKQFLQVE
ncbi:MAG: N-acyl homoserine lactonase family protein [Saprospiraceae bacterium]